MKFESPIDTIDNKEEMRQAGSEALLNLLKELRKDGAKYPNKREKIIKELIGIFTPEEIAQLDAELGSKMSEINEREASIYNVHKENNNTEEKVRFLIKKLADGTLTLPFSEKE